MGWRVISRRSEKVFSFLRLRTQSINRFRVPLLTGHSNMKANTFLLLTLTLETRLWFHNFGSAAFQPVAPLVLKIRNDQLALGTSSCMMPTTTQLYSRIHWPWHHGDTPKHESHLLHQGVTARFMPKWPAIVTYTLFNGWTDETSRAFQEAVDKVIQLNPILTGRVYRHRPFPIFHPRGDHMELRVDMGYFDPENHDFVTIVDKSDMELPQDMNCTTALDIMETQVIPDLDIHCESTGTEIRKKLPLFGAHVVRLPDDKACIAIKMSHCLGDGLTVRSGGIGLCKFELPTSFSPNIFFPF